MRLRRKAHIMWRGEGGEKNRVSIVILMLRSNDGSTDIRHTLNI